MDDWLKVLEGMSIDHKNGVTCLRQISERLEMLSFFFSKKTSTR